MTFKIYEPKDTEPKGTPFCICVAWNDQKHGHDELIGNAATMQAAEILITELKKSIKSNE